MGKGFVELAAAGDTTTGLEPPERTFEFVRDALRGADLRIVQVERVYSERGTFQEQSSAPHVRQHPRLAAAYASVPFDVVGVGSNHTGDWGPDAAEDTVRTFRDLGIATIGAGRNIAEAREPAIIEKDGLRIAFLEFVSVLLPQYWATEQRAGAVPLRVKTYYEPYEYQPGAPPRVVTVPDKRDTDLMLEDVRRAKEKADLVVACFHWGVHWMPKPLTDYQPILAHAAIDAGACLVLGTHPHVMQAVEVYNGAVIFYSLGNLSFHRRPHAADFCLPNREHEFKEVYSREIGPGQTYHFNRHFPEGGIAFIQLDRAGVRRATFAPTLMNSEGQGQFVRPDTAKFDELHRYLAWVSEGIPGGVTDMRLDGDRLLLFQRED